MQKKKRKVRYEVEFVLGFFLLFGTVGAIDGGIISAFDSILQTSVSLVLMVEGAYCGGFLL